MTGGVIYNLNPLKSNSGDFNVESSIKTRREIASQVLDHYSKKTNISGIILVGSLQEKPCDKYSDFDFFIIYSETSPLTFERLDFIKNKVNQALFVFLSSIFTMPLDD